MRPGGSGGSFRSVGPVSGSAGWARWISQAPHFAPPPPHHRSPTSDLRPSAMRLLWAPLALFHAELWPLVLHFPIQREMGAGANGRAKRGFSNHPPIEWCRISAGHGCAKSLCGAHHQSSPAHLTWHRSPPAAAAAAAPSIGSPHGCVGGEVRRGGGRREGGEGRGAMPGIQDPQTGTGSQGHQGTASKADTGLGVGCLGVKRQGSPGIRVQGSRKVEAQAGPEEQKCRLFLLLCFRLFVLNTDIPRVSCHS